jgi:flagellin
VAIGDITRIRTNIGALNALNALKSVNQNLEKIQLRLATGKRINSVSDDPAGYVISTRINARVRGLSVALDNIGTAKNMMSIAEGGLQNISDILITMKEKVTQAASDTLGSAERNAVKTELDQLTSEIDDIVEETTFNNFKLLDGTFTNKSIQTGANPTNTIIINLSDDNTSQALNVLSNYVSSKVFTAGGSSIALSYVDSAIEKVSNSLQKVGSYVSRLSIKENTLNIAITNNEATYSRIVDADLAQEQLNATKNLILQRTAVAQLTQANFSPASVLKLFR